MLLSDVFNSIKEINTLRKEMNRLLRKDMSNIYFKLLLRRSQEFGLCALKICHQISFGELQLTQISLNFKTSCFNLETRLLGAKLCVDFLLF